MIESNIWPKSQQPETESEVQAGPTAVATPVRYNVTRYGEMHNEPDGQWVRFEDYEKLRNPPNIAGLPQGDGATPRHEPMELRAEVAKRCEALTSERAENIKWQEAQIQLVKNMQVEIVARQEAEKERDSERAAREAAEKETQNISERLHEILERTGNTRNERDAAFVERDQLRSQLAEMTASRDKTYTALVEEVRSKNVAVNKWVGRLEKAESERDAALARVEELEEERKVLKGAISNANWLLSDHVDAGGGVKSLEQWSQAIAQDRKARYSALRADSVPTVADLLKWFRSRPGCSWVDTIADIEEALTAITKGENAP